MQYIKCKLSEKSHSEHIFDDHPDDVDLGACGNVVVDNGDADGDGGQGRRVDRSKLRLV